MGQVKLVSHLGSKEYKDKKVSFGLRRYEPRKWKTWNGNQKFIAEEQEE